MQTTFITPASSILLRRRQQGVRLNESRSLSSALEILASSCNNSRMARSVSSRLMRLDIFFFITLFLS